MADITSIPQHTIQASYGFQPSVVPTETRNIQMADYGPMMRAIEQAGQNILNSPINPEVRAQMQLGTQAAQAGQQVLSAEQKAGYLPWLMQIRGGQPSVEGLGALPSWAGIRLPLPGVPSGGGGGGGGSSQPQQPQGSQPETTQPPPTVQPTLSEQKSKQQQEEAGKLKVGPSSSATDASTQQIGTNQGQLASAYATGIPQQFQQTGALAPNPVGQYFASPGTSNVASAIPAAPGGGPQLQPSDVARLTSATQPGGGVNPSLFASTDNTQMLQQYAQQQEQAKQQQLTQWQNQNQGGVMSAISAKQWAQSNLDTDINRAVYMPKGGPGGEPAYAFYGKHGGTNVVPISQMVKAGAGPLVMAQNFSHVLSASDQQDQQQGAGAGAMPGAGAGAMPGPVGAAAGAGMPGPPPAPDQAPVSNVAGTPVNTPRNPDGSVNWAALPGQLSDQEFNRRVAASTNVPDKGGPTTDAFWASNADASGNPPSDEQKMLAQTKTTPEQVNQFVALQKAGKGETGLPNPNSRDTAHPDQYLGRASPDAPPWYKDSATGVPYAVLPGTDLVSERRWHVGDKDWTPFVVPELVQRNKVFEYLNGTKTWDEVKAMPMSEIKSTLEDQRYRTVILPTELATNVPPEVTANYNRLYNEVVYGRRALNSLPDNVTTTMLDNNRNARVGEGEWTPNPVYGNEWMRNLDATIRSGWFGKHSDDKLNYFDDSVDGLKKVLTTQNDKDDVTNAFSKAGTANGKQEIKNWLTDKENEFQRAMSAGIVNKYRLRGQDLDVSHAISENKPIYDPANKYATPEQKIKGPNQVADELDQQAKANATPAPAAPAATPFTAPGNKPPASGPGSVQERIHIQNREHYKGLRNVHVESGGNNYYIDPQGKPHPE